MSLIYLEFTQCWLLWGGQHPGVWVPIKIPKGLVIEGSLIIKKKKKKKAIHTILNI